MNVIAICDCLRPHFSGCCFSSEKSQSGHLDRYHNPISFSRRVRLSLAPRKFDGVESKDEDWKLACRPLSSLVSPFLANEVDAILSSSTIVIIREKFSDPMFHVSQLCAHPGDDLEDDPGRGLLQHGDRQRVRDVLQAVAVHGEEAVAAPVWGM